MTRTSKRLNLLAIGTIMALTACDSSPSSNPSASPASVARTCLDYVCHWAGIDSSEETSSLDGTPLRVYDTVHLELAADSSFRDWHVEAAYTGTSRYGLKPSRVTTGTWRALRDSLQLTINASPRSLPAALSPNLLILPRNGSPMHLTPR